MGASRLAPYQSLERRPGLRRSLRHQGLHLLQPAAHPAGARPHRVARLDEPRRPVRRGRWKIENENNNVLKTKGSHLEHNFGHGKQYLSAFMLSLNLLAFLVPYGVGVE